MMSVSKLISEGRKLLDAGKYDEAIKKLNKALKNIPDKTKDIQNQVDALFWLGQCYLKQAIKTSDTKQAELLFAKAAEHYRQLLSLLKQLRQNTTQGQMHTQFWLGHCYFEQALKTSDPEQAELLFAKAAEHHRQQLSLAKQLEGQDAIREQAYALYWLSRVVLSQKTFEKSDDQIKKYFEENPENKKEIKQYLEEAERLCEKLQDEELKDELETLIYQHGKELSLSMKDYLSYLSFKQKIIAKQLVNPNDLPKSVTSILAVLTISPTEFNKPLAHYTSPSVCEKLLGIEQIKPEDKRENEKEKKTEITPKKMRMGSSTYMNDPYEGKSLLDFLGIQEYSLENKTEFSPHNAFFTCFSARVNDLNQFRLYGKVSNVEASGCCLVFNKSGNWVNEPNIWASYWSLYPRNRSDSPEIKITEEFLALTLYEDLPLYQVAYIFYRDKYTEQDEHDIFNGTNPNFGIRLKPICDDPALDKARKEQLRDALEELRQHFNNQYPADQSVLEYIRYLFKDYAFRDEEEFRLLQIEELGSEKVKYCHETNSAYVEYADICNKLDEVILGTNYERAGGEQKVEAFRYLLKQKLPHIKVSHSSLPINAAQVVRKP